jgi:hypothetical protein
MKRILLLVFTQLCLLPAMNVFGDVVTLTDGRRISGEVESGTPGEIQVRTGEGSQTIAVDRIQSIRFSSTEAFSNRPAPPAAPAESNSITLPIGTEIAVRTGTYIDSKTADPNRTYSASLDDPVIVNGVQVAPANANAVLRVTDIKNPKLTGRPSLSLVLVSVTINGERVEVHTDKVDSHSGSRSKRSAIAVGGGAAAGAGIGGLAGGAVGAGIGAGIGAASGAIGAMMTGKGVEIAPETRFTYKLTQPAVINDQGGPR